MLFFKPKQKYEEILPPPPPFPTMEFEEEKEKPKFFDEVIDTEKSRTETIQEVREFDDLLKDFEKKPKSKGIKSRKEKFIPKKRELSAKKPKISKRLSLKQSKKIKEKKQVKLTTAKKDLDFELPEELKSSSEKEVKLPKKLEDFDLEDYGKELDAEKDFKSKPREIEEAEQEIKEAIEKIKNKEKPSFFMKLFAKKEKTEEKPKDTKDITLPKIPEVDDISKIKNSISNAREALMKFDLESAKSNYIKAMKLYKEMLPEDQAKVYHDINDLYFERKSAEELKV